MEQPLIQQHKIALIGAAGTGKTRLGISLAGRPYSEIYKPTVGVDFVLAITETARLPIWDIAGSELSGTMVHIYLKEAAAIVIVLDPNDKDNWPAQIQQCKAIVADYGLQKNANKPEILYVVNKWDKDDATELTLTNHSKITQDTCRETIKHESGNDEARIFFYSAKTSAKRNDLLEEILSIVPKADKKLLPLDDVSQNTPYPRPIKQPTTPTPYFTGLRMFGFLVLFATLGTTFLALGGVTGGVEQIWSNIGEFFGAIKLAVDFGPGALLTDWGIGVLVASILLAAAVTVGSMLIDYYRKTGDETGSKVPVNEKSGYTEIRKNQPPVTEPQSYKGPLAASQQREGLTDGPAATPQEKGWCTIL